MYKLFSNIEIDGLIELSEFKHSTNIFITPWSIAHFIYGYISVLLGFNYFWGFLIHSLYEYMNLTNDSVKNKWKKIYEGFRTDSFFNSIGDTVFFLIGMYLAKHYNNNLLFFVIFIIGVLFFSPQYQEFIGKARFNYIKKMYPNLKANNSNSNLQIKLLGIWIFLAIIVKIKAI
jgi:hypothetical protein